MQMVKRFLSGPLLIVLIPGREEGPGPVCSIYGVKAEGVGVGSSEDREAVEAGQWCLHLLCR